MSVLVLLMFSILSFNLNAAITVQKIWDPPSLSVSPSERVSCVQYRITTDVAVNIERVEVQHIGQARLVFQTILVRNGHGRVIGHAALDQSANITSIPLEKTVVLPDMDFLLTVEGETASAFPGEAIGRPTRLAPVWLRTSEGLVPLAESDAATFTAKEAPPFGSVIASKIGTNSKVYTGEKRFLGGFAINATSGGEFGAQMRLNLHVLGGNKEDVRNLTAVILYAGGGWQFTSLWKWQEYAEVKDFYTIGETVSASSSITLVGIFADVGQSFSNGGTIAVSTTPSQWDAWSTTGRRPVLSERTVVGPTITVVSQQGGKG